MNVLSAYESKRDEAAAGAAVIAVSVEAAAYVALLALALVLRVAELDSVPFSNAEAHSALAVWNVLSPGHTSVATASSPLIFTLQTMTFSVLGATEFAARIGTALAGAALVFTPLLFRELLGRSRAFLLCAILACSPALLVASRESSPVVWAMLLAALGGWCLWRFWQTEGKTYGALAAILIVSMIFLSDPAGYLLALALLGGGIAAVTLLRMDNPDAVETLEVDTPAEALAPPRSSPRAQGLSLAALAVLLVSTGFMLNPPGLSNIGALLAEGINGLTAPAPGTLPAHILLTSLFYEPFLWILALAGVVIALQRGITALDRFFGAWLAAAVIASLLFAGGASGYAVWLSVPLAALASRTAVEALSDDARNIWYIPGYARWLLALATVALLAVFSVSLQTIGRSLLRAIPTQGLEFITQVDPIGAILVIMVALFFIVGFFLAASVWNGATAARGGALGLLIFGMATSLGSGWNAAVPHAANPAELWHMQATAEGAPLLRETLLEIAKRESRGFPNMPVSVVAPDDGMVAWLLRDFGRLTYVDDAAEARTDEIVLLETGAGASEQPDLGGSYVGQNFVLRRGWSVNDLQPLDFVAWWLQRNVRENGAPVEQVTLWLRQDIYAGVPFEGIGAE